MRALYRRTTCRVCGSSQLPAILDLGMTPLANAFVEKRALRARDKMYPLRLVFCPRCSMIQLSDVVDPSILFADYRYRTGASAPLVKHFKEMARAISTQYRLNKRDLVVEFGSNDGALLGFFKKNAQF